MSKCTIHLGFFDDNCTECKREYADLKGAYEIPQRTRIERRREAAKGRLSNHKEFSEKRAKRLYEELILQYMSKGIGGQEAAERARGIVRKQCTLRGIDIWPWLR